MLGVVLGLWAFEAGFNFWVSYVGAWFGGRLGGWCWNPQPTTEHPAPPDLNHKDQAPSTKHTVRWFWVFGFLFWVFFVGVFGLGFWVLGFGCSVLGARVWVIGIWRWVVGAVCRVPVLGAWVLG